MDIIFENSSGINGEEELSLSEIWTITKKGDPNKLLKQGIWAYFLLLIFEGALRKWVLPGLSTPLLLIRDPIAIGLVLVAAYRKLLTYNFYMTGLILIGIVAIYTAVFAGHGNLIVALYGARIFIFHFPLIFVIGRVFTRADVEYLGKVTTILVIPLTILIALQFFTPQSSLVNRGVGGNMEGGGFNGGAMGYLRPSGTFSFTNGSSLFFSFSAPFIFYFWLAPKEKINRFLLIVATACLIASIPLSISRSLFFQIVITLIFALMAVSRKPKYIGKMMKAITGIVIALAVLSQVGFFKTSMEAFTERFVGANESEGGLNGVLGDRYLNGLAGSVLSGTKVPVLGYGIGMGSSVGGMLLTGDTVRISEDDWGREIGELGLTMGLLVILIRVGLTLKVAVGSYRKLVNGDLLPWLILSFGLLILPQGEWAQPTALGFSIFVGGLMLASTKKIEKKLTRIKSHLTPDIQNINQE
jgi:hypothetical protein